MAADPMLQEETDRIREALESSDDIDARRIEVHRAGEGIRLAGWIPTPEQATVAVLIAEEAVPGTKVESDLAVDRDMETMPEDASPAEQATPARDEQLVGSTDMLSGQTEDIGSEEQLARGEPWDPPEHPSGVSTESAGGPVAEAPPPDGDSSAAADLTTADLHAAGRGRAAPALDPDSATAMQPATDRPPERVRAVEPNSPMVTQVSGTRPGPGANAESATQGGSTGSRPATETGSINADTAQADPSRYAS